MKISHRDKYPVHVTNTLCKVISLCITAIKKLLAILIGPRNPYKWSSPSTKLPIQKVWTLSHNLKMMTVVSLMEYRAFYSIIVSIVQYSYCE